MTTSHRPTILLITPPLTQVNTPYPATAVIKGFLKAHNYHVFQADLGLELVLDLFSRKQLKELFRHIRSQSSLHTPDIIRALALEDDYLTTIQPVIHFLQHQDPTLAHRISAEGFLPEGPRFLAIEDMDWAFGTLGVQDKAKLLATQYLEDIADLIRDFISEDFGFSRYAERLGLSALSFQQIELELDRPDNLIDQLMLKKLSSHLNAIKPDLIGFSIPFPGCLFGALKCAQFVRKQSPDSTIMMGGGYVNTELRSLESSHIFKYIDYITLDDGELPSLQIARHLEGEIDRSELIRTYCLIDNKVHFIHQPETIREIPFSSSGTPDYSDLMLDKYLSIIEIANPMHRLWSDGRWNKLTLAHGCYWKKCAFCDVTLDYIARYDPITAKQLVDRIEVIMEQTGQSGFHFVDEAAPPHLLKELAIEILKRRLVITWWTNIRFEKKFSNGLCKLLAASGCIAVSGGLETASDRLLKKMNKGVTIAQAARATNNLQDAGIMVHAYLMFGFPTQSEQETIDALEVVRQFFLEGLIQSVFWHRFALTIHSLVGQHPQDYGIEITGPVPGDFAMNDLQYLDPVGAEHDRFSEGLNKAVYNFMHGVGLDFPLGSWFDFNISKTTCKPHSVSSFLRTPPSLNLDQKQMMWIGPIPELSNHSSVGKGKKDAESIIMFNRQSDYQAQPISEKVGRWVINQLNAISLAGNPKVTFGEWRTSYEETFHTDFSLFMKTDIWLTMTTFGLVLL